MKFVKVGICEFNHDLCIHDLMRYGPSDGYAIEHNGLCTTVCHLIIILYAWYSTLLVVIQVFSAPNYVDQAGNKGAFVRLSLLERIQLRFKILNNSMLDSHRLRGHAGILPI